VKETEDNEDEFDEDGYEDEDDDAVYDAEHPADSQGIVEEYTTENGDRFVVYDDEEMTNDEDVSARLEDESLAAEMDRQFHPEKYAKGGK
jgi:hypothetical protein